MSSQDTTAGTSLLAAALALFCESEASRLNFFAGGGILSNNRWSA